MVPFTSGHVLFHLSVLGRDLSDSMTHLGVSLLCLSSPSLFVFKVTRPSQYFTQRWYEVCSSRVLIVFEILIVVEEVKD